MSSAEPYFDPYGQPPPPGEWDYILDDFDVQYGPGWWPFYRDGRPCGIRISPDADYRAWRNEYVLLRPGTDAGVTAKVTLYCRPQGLGAIVVNARIHLDLRARTARIITACPDEVREQAETKATRLLALSSSPPACSSQGPASADDRPPDVDIQEPDVALTWEGGRLLPLRRLRGGPATNRRRPQQG